MDISVIDLCDSDDGAVASSFASAAVRKTTDANDDDDSENNSSSSSDIDLWSAGKSSHSLARCVEIHIDIISFPFLKRNSYYYQGLSKRHSQTKPQMQLKSDTDDVDERKTKRQKRRSKDQTSSSPVAPLEMDDGCNDSIDNNHKRKYDLSRNENNDRSVKSDDKATLTFGSSKMESHSSKGALHSNDKLEVQCIEIDLSDGSSPDEIVRTKPKFCEIGSATSNDGLNHSTKLRSEKLQSSTAMKESQYYMHDDNANFGRRMKHWDASNSRASPSSDSSVSLDVMGNTSLKGMKGSIDDASKGTARLTFNDHDTYDLMDSDHSTGVDFSCELSGSINDNHHENDDKMQVLEVDSDNSDNDSTVDEMLTSRPFKARVKNQLVVETDASKSSATKYPTPLLELATPRAYSPTTTSPTLGAYATKRKVPTPAIPAMSASLLKEIGGKLYPDLRHNFVLALTSHARRLRHNAYQRAAFEAALRAIVVIR